MRIGYDAKRLFHNRGGLGNYARNTIQYLSEYIPNHQYLLYTPSQKHTPLFDIEHIADNISIKTPPAYMQGVLKSVWRSWKIASQLNHDHIDIYHGLSNELPISIKKNNSIKTVVTIHDLIFLRYPQFYPTIDRWMYRKKFFNSSTQADIIIAVSEQTKADLINFYHINPDKIRVAYQGCDSTYFGKREENEIAEVKEKFNLPEQYLLSVGTIEMRKNILSILEALHNNRIDIPLVVVGKATEYIKIVKTYITQHQMTNQVVFIHDATNYELSSIYQSALLTIYPSLFEGFGIPIIESLASAIPVIATNGSSLTEAGGNAAWYINPANTEEMGNAISSIASDTTLRNTMIAKGHTHVEQFKGQNVAINLNKIYTELR